LISAGPPHVSPRNAVCKNARPPPEGLATKAPDARLVGAVRVRASGALRHGLGERNGWGRLLSGFGSERGSLKESHPSKECTGAVNHSAVPRPRSVGLGS
jgi:hypothetical protein